MKLPPDVEFHEDIRLLIWRPRDLVNEAASVIWIASELMTVTRDECRVSKEEQVYECD